MSVSNLQDALDLLQNQEVEAAISTLEKTVEEIPAHLPAHVLLARAYELKEAWNDALRSWENAHFLMPNSPTVGKGRARATSQITERREAAERASAQGPLTEPARPKDAEPRPTSDPDPSPSEEASPEPDSSAETAGSEAAGPDPSSPDPSSSPSPGASTGEPDGLSGLEKLRQQAEAEARQGGARPGLSAQQRLQQDREDAQKPSASPGDPAPGSTEETDEQEDDVTGNLDRLIRELESARIDPRPDPDEEDDFDDLPEPDLDDDIDDLVSETLARIYAAQEKYEEAARIYVKLASQEPTQARHHLENAAAMQEKAKTQG